MYIGGWLSDYLGAGNFIEPQFACGPAGFSNTSGWCDDALEGEIDEALPDDYRPRRFEPDMGRDRPPFGRGLGAGAVTNPVFTHAVADRVENVQVHPQWGLMLSLMGAVAEFLLSQVGERPSVLLEAPQLAW